ncbi:hypothetical protein F2Q68_00039064, partial [Brassica cretica]
MFSVKIMLETKGRLMGRSPRNLWLSISSIQTFCSYPLIITQLLMSKSLRLLMMKQKN